MKKYVTGNTHYGVDAKIEEVEIERETDASVWINGARSQKVSEWKIFHDTWEGAHSQLVQRAEEKVKYAKKALESARSRLGNVKAMKKPEEV